MRAGGLPFQVDAVTDQWLATEGRETSEHGQVNPVVFSHTWDRAPADRLHGHVHSGLELGMVLSGQSTLLFEAAERRCGPGDIWLCSMWEPHAWHIRDSGGSGIAVVFYPDLLLDQLEDDPPYLDLFALPPAQRPGVQDEKMRERFLETGREIERENAVRAPYWQTLVRLGLLRILADLSRAASRDRSQAGSADVSQHHRTLAKLMPAVRLTHEQPWRRTTAADAAALCSISTSLFQRSFRRAMGMSFGKFRLRARLAYAAHRLLHTDETIAQIAAEAGFTDSSHLHHAFRKQHGCTPTAYRER